MMGMKFTTRVVTIAPGQTARVNIDVPAGTASLTVRPQAPEGALVNGMVYGALGALESKTGRALQYEMARLAPEASTFSIMIASNPVTLESLQAGTWTACIVPLPSEVRGMGPSMEYIEREGENLPVFCATKPLAAPTQEVTIPVQLPTYVPPPAGAQGT
jgi:hypothetical protein